MSVQNANSEIHQGAIAPYAFKYDVTSEDAVNFDLSTVTSATFEIVRENGNPDSWTAALSGATATALTLTHTFVAGDVDQLETLKITPVMVTPSGSFFGQTRTLRVRPPDEL